MKPGKGETYSDLTKPLRELTRQGVWYKWTKECQSSFTRLKGLLCEDTVLVCYDPKRSTRVYVDHGPEGVASTVAQRYDVPGKDPEYRPVAYISRSLKAPEKNYSKVEGESLAVLSGVKMNKQYLYGTKFEVVVDHKPLLPLYNSPNRPAPVRVDRHKAKLLAFRFSVVYEPGYTTPSDYGSRHPEPDRKHSKQEREDLGIEDEEEDKEFSVNRLIEDRLPDAVTLPLLKLATGGDVVLAKVMEDVRKGKMSSDTETSGYGKVFEELTVADGVLLRGEKLVIPSKLQADVIALAHEGHGLGESKTVSLLRERVWFPRLSRMTKEYVSTCRECASAVPGNTPAPVTTREMPGRPWEVVAADFKGPIGGPRGYYFHVVIDLYSRWPEVAMTKSTSFESLQPKLDEVWATHGVPEKVVHDGGPPYNSHSWRKYAKSVGFESEMCTPEHPQSNGLAEKFMSSVVKVTHAALAAKKDPVEEMNRFLMNYRAAPHSSTGKSPSELLNGRKMKMKVPAVIPKPKGKIHKEAQKKNKEEKEKQKKYADKHRKAKDKKVEKGDQVLIKQDKTTTKPPWNPEPFTVEEVKGTKIVAKRGELTRTRNVEKFKILKKRPDYLKVKPRSETKVSDDSEEEDWMETAEITVANQPEREENEGAGADLSDIEELEIEDIPDQLLATPRRERRKPNRYDPARVGPQQLKQKSPKQRKRAQSEARFEQKRRGQARNPSTDRVRMPSGEWRTKF